MEEFQLNFLLCLKDEQIANSLIEITKKGNKDLIELVASLNIIVQDLKTQLQLRDTRITKLENENEELREKIDDQEQYTRRASIRVFGIPENTPGNCEEKILALCNEHMHLAPPILLDEIEVSHRTGKREAPAAPAATQNAQDEDASPPTQRPRPVLVKFVSRRSKARVMAVKKLLKNINKPSGEDETDLPEDFPFPNPVYIADDLTPRRSKLAFKARGLKKQGKIEDTWVYDCRVLMKDLRGVIRQINNDNDLKKYETA